MNEGGGDNSNVDSLTSSTEALLIMERSSTNTFTTGDARLEDLNQKIEVHTEIPSATHFLDENVELDEVPKTVLK